MKLGVMGVRFGPQLSIDLDFIHRAEALGFDSTWTAEAYGNDAVTTAAWILAQTARIKVGTAIMQMPARTPAMTAMTAMSLDHLSGGRFLLGIGPSGPQVVEGWHGVPYGRPLTRTRETIAILRQIFAREAPLVHEGYHYHIPLTGAGTTGLGKPLKSILHGNPALPIYTAAISPKGLACAAEVADGVLPLWMNPERFDLLEPHLAEGFAQAGGGKGLDRFAVCPSVSVVISHDLEQARAPIKLQLALYIGGMGARDKNFYTDYAKRLGYEAAATRIQDLFLDGKKAEAVAAVPDALVDDICLIGPEDRIRERLGAWKEAGRKRWVDTLLVAAGQPEALELLAKELL
ncbi:MAG: LLM class F420-dependent oxidoreductase [Myxococcales bacterium]|nr:LLM class F420-dependent oxidoreductase [Myxococcales bacterium]